MDEPLRRHLVDERNRLRSASFTSCRIVAVDRGADVAQRAAKTRAELPVVLAALDVLAVRFERGIVTGHCWIDPCNT